MKIDKPTERHKQLMMGLLDAFRLLGPIESLDWLVNYFDDYSTAMQDHGHPVPWVDDLVAELKLLITKYGRLE